MSRGDFAPRTVILSVAALFAVAACQVGSPPAATQPAVPTTPATTPSEATPGAASPTPASAECTSVTMEGGQGVFADALRAAYFDPFEEETGIEVIPAPEDDNSIIRGMVETGQYTVDVEYVGVDWVLPPNSEQYLEPLDYSVINSDGILEGLAQDYGVGFDAFSLVLGWRPDKIGDQTPETWADLFDVETFPGKRSFNDLYAYHPIIVALLADGVSPDDLIPFDFQRAFGKLDLVKADYVSSQSGSQQMDLFSSGEVAMGMIFPNRAAEASEAGAPVEISWHGQLIETDFLAIPKGNPNKDCAMKLIAYIVSQPVNGRISFEMDLGPANTESDVNPEVEEFLPASHLDVPHVIIPDPELGNYLQENQDEIAQQFQEWQTE